MCAGLLHRSFAAKEAAQDDKTLALSHSNFTERHPSRQWLSLILRTDGEARKIPRFACGTATLGMTPTGTTIVGNPN
jgi:hypothetical protein